MVPLLALARPQEVTTLILFTVLLGHLFPPVDVGLLLLAGFPSGGEHWIMGNVLIIMFAITYAC